MSQDNHVDQFLPVQVRFCVQLGCRPHSHQPWRTLKLRWVPRMVPLVTLTSRVL
jgi:hypothetical protein